MGFFNWLSGNKDEYEGQDSYETRPIYLNKEGDIYQELHSGKNLYKVMRSLGASKEESQEFANKYKWHDEYLK